jgi:hypothetical protein
MKNIIKTFNNYQQIIQYKFSTNTNLQINR